MSAPYFTLPEFKYVKPQTLEEALKILAENAGEAKILNGGIGVLGFMKERMIEAKILVDIKGIKELKKIEYMPGKGLIVGATVTANELLEYLEKNPEIKKKFLALYESTSELADAILRNRATIIGNILEGLPYTDAPGPAILFEAEVKAVSTRGERVLPVEGLVLGPMMTRLEPDEIVTEILYKEPPDGARTGYVKFNPGLEYGYVNVAALVANPDNPQKRDVRIVITSATTLPFRPKVAEEVFKQDILFEKAAELAAKKIEEEIEPLSDPYASAEYRRYLASTLTYKLLIKLARGE
jgi:carbon-monoxide dehydrogenase medium subunit